jgi:hypothetical protein
LVKDRRKNTDRGISTFTEENTKVSAEEKKTKNDNDDDGVVAARLYYVSRLMNGKMLNTNSPVACSAVTGTRNVCSVPVRVPEPKVFENKNFMMFRRSFLDFLPSMVCVCPEVTECVMESSNSAIVVAMQP